MKKKKLCERTHRRLMVKARSGKSEFCFHGRFQGKIEGRSLVRCSFSPNPPLMAMNDALHNGQPDSGSLKVPVGMKPLKNVKQFAGVLHIKPDTVVFHKKSRFSALRPASHFDASQVAGARVFNSIAQQID